MSISNLMRLQNFDFHIKGQKHRPLGVVVPSRTIGSGKVDRDGNEIPMAFSFRCLADVGTKMKTVKKPLITEPHVLVQTESMGFGLYALNDMKPGDIVSPYVGFIIDDRSTLTVPELAARSWTHFKSLQLEVGKQYIIDSGIDRNAKPGEKGSLEWYVQNGDAGFANSMKNSRTTKPNCKVIVVKEKLTKQEGVAHLDFPEVGVPFPADSKRLVAVLIVQAHVKAGEELHWSYANKCDGRNLFKYTNDRVSNIPLNLMRQETHGNVTLLYAKDHQAAAAELEKVKIKPDPDAKPAEEEDDDEEGHGDSDDDDDDAVIICDDEEVPEDGKKEEAVNATTAKDGKKEEVVNARLTAIAAATGMSMNLVQAVGQLLNAFSGADAATDSPLSATGPATKNPRGILKNKTPDQAGPDLSTKKRKVDEFEASDETGALQPQKAFKVQIDELNVKLTEKNNVISALETKIITLSAEKEELQKQYDALLPRFATLEAFIQNLHTVSGNMLDAAKKT